MENPIVAGQGAKKIDRTLLITHHFKFHRILEAYDTFARASETSALKVIIDMQSVMIVESDSGYLSLVAWFGKHSRKTVRIHR